MTDRCLSRREDHGVLRRCKLDRGHKGDHEAAGSAGPIRWPVAAPERTAAQPETWQRHIAQTCGDCGAPCRCEGGDPIVMSARCCVHGEAECAAQPEGAEPETIYVASRSRHADMWLRLRARGYPIRASWLDEAAPGATSDWPGLWQRCTREAAAAHTTILYASEDECLRGAWVEVGVALANNRRVIAVAPDSVLGNIARDPRIERAATALDALDMALAARAAPQAAQTPTKEG